MRGAAGRCAAAHRRPSYTPPLKLYILLLTSLLPYLAAALFPVFWVLICWLLARRGWGRLVPYFHTAQQPPGPQFWLGLATVGGVSYKNAIRASVSPQGLRLSVLFLFRVGHPPLLIPWAALGPLHPETSWWLTFSTTTIGLPTGERLDLRFAHKELAAAMQPWLPPAAPGATAPALPAAASTE